MSEFLERNDIEEKRSKCVICGYELTYPEYITDNRCVFHSEKRLKMGFIAWICFAMGEYRVMRLKSLMRDRGYNEHDYTACVNLQKEEIGDIQSVQGMKALCKELKAYTCKT